MSLPQQSLAGCAPPLSGKAAMLAEYAARRCAVCGSDRAFFGFERSERETVCTCAAHRAEADAIFAGYGRPRAYDDTSLACSALLPLPPSHVLSSPFIVTTFPNARATQKQETTVTDLTELAREIEQTTALAKKKLEWLKLARFGELQTDKGCLRHDANVIAITGIEADYDGGTVSFDTAIGQIRDARILALGYTSPSHTDAKPRWRMLAPTSCEYPPAQRDRLVARLNGVLGGVVATESWTLSQSYFWGSVNNNPAHRAVAIPGTPIDLMAHLDAGAIGKPATTPAPPPPIGHSPAPEAAAQTDDEAADRRLDGYRRTVIETLRRRAVDGQKHYALLRAATALGGIQGQAKFTDETALEWLGAALPPSVKDWGAARRTATDGLARGREKPLTLEDRPPPKPTVARDDPRRKALARAVLHMTDLGQSDAKVNAAAHLFNAKQIVPSVPGNIVDAILTWARRQAKAGAHG